MQERNLPRLVFNSTTYPINLNFTVFASINNDISTSLYQDHEYNVRSNVSTEVFESFIDYLFNDNNNIPTITPENIDQYYLLNQEFQSSAINHLIESQRETFDEVSINLNNLRSPLVQDKTNVEQTIAHNLDEYVTQRGDELISAPIQSLVRIMSNTDLVFTQHNRLYELIISEHQRTNDVSTFALLPFLKLDELTPENRRDSIENQQSRAGMIPDTNLLSLFNKIDEQREELLQLKENYKQISKLFIRSHAIKFNIYGRDDENSLLEACERGDVEEVSSKLQIFTSDHILNYRLNLIDLTAKVIQMGREFNLEELTVPSSIRYNNIDFIVTSLDERSIEYCEIQNIIFPEDSQVRSMHDNAIYPAHFDTIKLPPLLEKFNIKMQEHMLKFENIKVWPNSRNFKILNENLFVGKSDINSETFDTIIFAKNDIREITIPDSITTICTTAFSNCRNLATVTFSENSQLRVIEESAFASTVIESLTIPSHVIKIAPHAFYNCRNLRLVNFAPNSELRLFSRCMFMECSIENLTIPKSLEILQDRWYDGISDSCHITISQENHNFRIVNEKLLVGKSNPNSNNYDVVLFALRDTEEVNIPDEVTKIGNNAFTNCKRLRTIHFSENSQLSVIDHRAFADSSLETIIIPSHVQIIENFAFGNCKKLRTFEYAPHSELRAIKPKVFYSSSLQNLVIPCSVVELQNKWYEGIDISCRISVSPENHNFRIVNEKLLVGKSNPNSNNYDVLLFAFRDTEEVNIPDEVTKIGNDAFTKCKRLITIHFSENSQLSVIDSHAFSESSITRIVIPKHVTDIGQFAFYKCNLLRIVEFAQDSELRIIGESAFAEADLRELIVPQHVVEIKSRAFNKCRSLNSFHFAPNSELRIIGSSAFMASSFTSISIPSSVIEIQSNAFSDCGLQTIVFPDDSQIQQVGDHLFYSTTIRNATIPPHLTEIIHFE